MNEKHVFISDVVPAGQMILSETEAPGAGDEWVIESAAITDEAIGDGKSSVMALLFGSEFICRLSSLGTTFNMPIGKQYEGDGQKKFKIYRMNKSNEDKQITVSIKAFKRS